MAAPPRKSKPRAHDDYDELQASLRRRLAYRLSDPDVAFTFSPDARRKLIAVNAGYRVEPGLDELEEWISSEIIAFRRLDSTTKERAAAVGKVKKATKALRVALKGLPRQIEPALWYALGVRHRYGNELSGMLRDLERACREVLTDRDEIPAAGGRPSNARRNRLIVRVWEFSYSLEPTRATRGQNLARVNAARGDEGIRVPIQDPQAALRGRCLASVKIVCEALNLPLPVDVERIVSKVLSKEPE